MHDHPDEQSDELRAVFARLRERYAYSTPPLVGPGLSAHLGVDLTNDNGDLSVTAASNADEPALRVVGLPNWRASTTRGRQRIMQPIAAFIGTAIGKVVLGTTVAAASVGAGHATGVIDVTPSSDPPPVVVTDDELDDDETTEVESDEIEATDDDGSEPESDDAGPAGDADDEVDDDDADDEVEDAEEIEEEEVDEVDTDEVDTDDEG